jgi:hypothetical protein
MSIDGLGALHWARLVGNAVSPGQGSRKRKKAFAWNVNDSRVVNHW